MNNHQLHNLKKEDITTHKGRSNSFWMHDPVQIFGELYLAPNEVFLDLGCGVGQYSIYASNIIRKTGTIYALDKNETLIRELKEKAILKGLSNIQAMCVDITNTLPLDDNSIDVCLVATVLHGITEEDDRNSIFREIRRVLKPSGRLFTIDCSKKDDSFGPPMSMRLAPEQIESYALRHDFRLRKTIDIGFNYMLCFEECEL